MKSYPYFLLQNSETPTLGDSAAATDLGSKMGDCAYSSTATVLLHIRWFVLVVSTTPLQEMILLLLCFLEG